MHYALDLDGQSSGAGVVLMFANDLNPGGTPTTQ